MAHLADRIFPAVPVRQFVSTLPIDLRLLLIPGDVLAVTKQRVKKSKDNFGQYKRVPGGVALNQALAAAIDNDKPDVLRAFKPPFDSKGGWMSFLDSYRKNRTSDKFIDAQNLYEAAPASTGWRPTFLRDEEARGRKHACRERLQAIYIACWITFPIEKGTFMVSLQGDELAKVNSMVATLPGRGSSHLEGWALGGAYSAGGKTFNFAEGYDELLVQVHRNELLLKMEGHQVGLAHIKSYFHKAATGAGLTASAQLNVMATGGVYGVTARAAENFGKSYEALVKVVGFGNSRMVTVPQLLTKLVAHCRAAPRFFTAFPSLIGLFIYSRVEYITSPAESAQFIRGLLAECEKLNAANRLAANPNAAAPLLNAFWNARDDLEALLPGLDRDASDWRRQRDRSYERFQGEVKLTPDEIDQAVNRLWYYMIAAPWSKPEV